MLTRDHILQRVCSIIRDEAVFSNTVPICPTDRFRHELKTDNLCLLNLYAALEDEFGIEFTMLELTAHGYRDGLTVADLVDAVAGKLRLPAAEAAA